MSTTACSVALWKLGADRGAFMIGARPGNQGRLFLAVNNAITMYHVCMSCMTTELLLRPVRDSSSMPDIFDTPSDATTVSATAS